MMGISGYSAKVSAFIAISLVINFGEPLSMGKTNHTICRDDERSRVSEHSRSTNSEPCISMEKVKCLHNETGTLNCLNRCDPTDKIKECIEKKCGVMPHASDAGLEAAKKNKLAIPTLVILVLCSIHNDSKTCFDGMVDESKNYFLHAQQLLQSRESETRCATKRMLECERKACTNEHSTYEDCFKHGSCTFTNNELLRFFSNIPYTFLDKMILECKAGTYPYYLKCIKGFSNTDDFINILNGFTTLLTI